MPGPGPRGCLCEGNRPDSLRFRERFSRVVCVLALLVLVAPVAADEVDDAVAVAWRAYQGGDVNGAIAALERLKESEPDDVRPNSKLAFMLLANDGDPARVFDLLAEHLQVHRGDEWALQHLAIAADRALAAGRPELARDCAKVLKEAQPGEKEHRYLWARASYRLGRRDSVAEACRSLIDDYPSWELPYWLLARTLSDQGEYDEAVEVYRELLEELPGNVDARLRMANAQLTQRDYEQAEESYRSALELSERGSPLRAMAESGIAFVAAERALSKRLREQNAFLDLVLLVVGGGWAGVIVILLVATRPARLHPER